MTRMGYFQWLLFFCTTLFRKIHVWRRIYISCRWQWGCPLPFWTTGPRTIWNMDIRFCLGERMGLQTVSTVRTVEGGWLFPPHTIWTTGVEVVGSGVPLWVFVTCPWVKTNPSLSLFSKELYHEHGEVLCTLAPELYLSPGVKEASILRPYTPDTSPTLPTPPLHINR